MSQSVGNDAEGCRCERTTHELDGKKYIVEKRSCPGVPEQTTETFVNLTRDELPNFLQYWQPKPALQQQDPEITGKLRDPDLFNKFFGPK